MKPATARALPPPDRAPRGPAAPRARRAPALLPVPRPFLKWAGGKGQLLPELLTRVEQAGPPGTYHEVFVGGGALFFELRRRGLIPGRVVLSDANPNLVNVWWAVRDHVDALVARLRVLAEAVDEESYYRVREEQPEDPIDRAARVIYLNKTCFNGLYRENSKGRFNVPFGRNANPTVCDERNLRACAAALRDVEILCTGFGSLPERVAAGDLVYLDPPYVPLSASSSFTRYAKDDFGPEDQARLAAIFGELGSQGVRAILSNSAAPAVRTHYAGWRVEEVLATRNVNRDAAGRGAIAELMVCNYGPDGLIRRAPHAPRR